MSLSKTDKILTTLLTHCFSRINDIQATAIISELYEDVESLSEEYVEVLGLDKFISLFLKKEEKRKKQ